MFNEASFRSIALNDTRSFNEGRLEVEVVDDELVSIKAATASVQNPWNREIPILQYVVRGDFLFKLLVIVSSAWKLISSLNL